MEERLLGKTILPFTGSRYDQTNVLGNYDETIPTEENSENYDFSNIDDDFIEKYSNL